VIVRRETVVGKPVEDVWQVVSDPHRLPEWWPGVARVEDATALAWTTVLTSAKGKSVRADYTREAAEEPTRIAWRQELAGTPFERILAESVTSVELTPSEDGTRVALALEQTPRGWARLAPFQFRAAAKGQVDSALKGLEGLFA
jgi:uncharacterized protein YndB with AHSA1/START domain